MNYLNKKNRLRGIVALGLLWGSLMGSALAGDPCITVTFTVSCDSNAGCVQARPNEGFATVNGSQVIFNTLAHSTVSYGATAVESTSVGCFSKNILQVGANTFNIQFVYGNLVTLFGTTSATFILEKGKPNQRVLCQAVQGNGSANGYSCQTSLRLSLSDVHPELASDLASLMQRSRSLEHELKSLEEGSPSTDQLSSQLDAILIRDFESLTPDEFLRVSQELSEVAELVRAFKQDVESLRSQLTAQLDDFRAYVAKAHQDAVSELRNQGLDPDDPLSFDANGLADLTLPGLQVPPIVVTSKFDSHNNVYTSLAGATLQKLRNSIANADAAMSNLIIEAWSKTVATLGHSLRLRVGTASTAELRAFNDSVRQVQDLIDTTFDDFGFFKKSSVPEDARAAIKGSIFLHRKSQAKSLRDAFNSWGEMPLNDQQRLILDVVRGVAAGFQALGSLDTNDPEKAKIEKRLSDTLDETIQAAKMVTRLGMSFTPLGKFVDFCEVITGKEFCNPAGPDLSPADRVMSAAGMAIGSGAFWKAMGKVVRRTGISAFGASVSKVTKSADRIGGFDKNALKLAKNHVGKLKAIRLGYDKEVSALSDLATQLLKKGNSKEQVARKLSGLRRDIGARYKLMMPEELQKIVRERNIEKYGDPLGPTIEYLIKRAEQKGLKGDQIWEKIIESSSRPDNDLNAFIQALEM